MTTRDRQPVVVIGIGNTFRRDDGLGPLTLDVIKRNPLPGCDFVELDGEAARVIETWRDRDVAVVIDAVCTGAQAGTIHDLTLDEVASLPVASATSSHFAGLAEALALGRSMGRLPGTLRVLGVEPDDVKRGIGLSPPVAAVQDELVRRVRAAVTIATGS